MAHTVSEVLDLAKLLTLDAFLIKGLNVFSEIECAQEKWFSQTFYT